MKTELNHNMVALLFLVTVLFSVYSFIGCSTYRTIQTDTSYDEKTGHPIRSISTEVKASTKFDSQSQLANSKASQTDKTQSATLGSLNQVSSSTNAVRTLEQLNLLLLRLGL